MSVTVNAQELSFIYTYSYCVASPCALLVYDWLLCLDQEKYISSVTLVIRVPQLASELLVVGITWWHTYESYRIRKGTKLGNTIGALLFYNGSMYFLFLATLYTLDIIFSMAPLPVALQDAATFLEAFIDSYVRSVALDINLVA
ncbi:hypothetical protein V8D89_001225 [Ganoderma adspersum]